MKRETLGKVIRITDMLSADMQHMNYIDGDFNCLMFLPLTQVNEVKPTNKHWVDDGDTDWLFLRPSYLKKTTKGNEYLHGTVFLGVKYEIVSETTISNDDFFQYSKMFDDETIVKMLNQ